MSTIVKDQLVSAEEARVAEIHRDRQFGYSGDAEGEGNVVVGRTLTYGLDGEAVRLRERERAMAFHRAQRERHVA